MNNSWIEIIEGNLEDLMVLRAKHLAEDSNSLQATYIQVLYHFLKNENSELESLVKSLSARALPEAFGKVLKIRLSYRQFALSLKITESLYSQIRDDETSIWKAEALFILALSFQRQASFVQAEHCFQMASEIYKSQGALRKSLRCWGNAIAALSCHHPESFLIQEYKSLYDKSFELEEWPTCAGALINLSREFQRMGAFALAFEKAKLAETISERHLFFSREHHLSLLQKAHLLHCLNRIFELQQIMPILLNSTFPEVSESANVLIAKIEGKEIIAGEHVLPTWLERAGSEREFENKAESDSLESELIRLLSQGIKSKEELIQQLYGDKIDFLTLENRFKNILSRARKKLPGRIVISGGKYELVDVKPQGKSK